MPVKEICLLCKKTVHWVNGSSIGSGSYIHDVQPLDRHSVVPALDDEAVCFAEGLGAVVCAWCGAILGRKAGIQGRTSHGICQECLDGLGSENRA